ncbi:deleted in malignant brain tumors 1 protein isoform X5 [Cyprinus carpio]|uniref:Deleted in malignant brain tumors 1 protein isoform X5 n=1 Tax=Cyprinus carpio TaxID=7962 RepID=A0A9Q9XA91_CYPCA|nr:deleted in malignant brain tumors 1 protein isoform X5 [Cyprinus carpio]
MEALTLLLCLLLTTFQANTIGSWTTDNWLDFTESFSEPCGGNMTDWRGVLLSPWYPNNYPNNAQCTWTIHSTGNSTVSLIFTDVDLETCCDYIKVYDGPSTLHPLLGEIREYRNQSFKSSNNDLTVFFYSDSSVTRRGFYATWLFVESCGGYMTDWMGDFSSPRYPNNYPDNSYCTWTIHSTGNMTVSLTFTDVVLETCCDYIKVYDGPSTLHPLLGEIREYRNQSFKSSSNDLTVFFYSDSSVTRRGFHANWVFVDVGNINTTYTTITPETNSSEPCGGNMTDWRGVLLSPRYPNNYPNNAQCTWTIHSTGNATVSLIFTDVDLETCCDYIKVYDGPSTLHPLLGEIREYRNQSFKSSSNDLTVFFYSDSSVTRRGFHANWVFVDVGNINTTYTTITPETNSSEPCGGNMTDWRGVLLSPRYPNNYPNDTQCTWTIHSTGNATVSLIFTDVDLETCCDYIKVYDGPSTLHPFLGEIREYRNQSFKSSNNDLTVFFYSDHSVTRRGFYATWLFVESCGGYMTDWIGDFSSPRYPNNYPDNSYCTWTIHSTGNMTVSLTFTDVVLETCCDYIKVYDGPSSHHTLLGEIREYRNQSFKSSNNDLTVFFFSDGSSTKKGFHANWVFVDSNSCRNNCGYSFGSCSCDYSCQYNSNCCSDYNYYCSSTTIWPQPTTEITTESWTTDSNSCRNNCGYSFGSCSCDYSCQYNSNCCYDYNYYCSSTTSWPQPTTEITTESWTTDSNSCRNNCGYSFGSCSCHYSCQYNSNCCSDYNYYCSSTISWPQPTTEITTESWTTDSNSCRNNCGYSFGSCSCHYSCQHNSNCCYDYNYYCSSTTIWPQPAIEHVNCSSDNMVIVIQMSYLNSLGLRGNDLYVDDRLCRPNISSTEVVFRFPLDACGTVKGMMNSYVSYTNNVRASQSQSGTITRQSNFLLRVGCRMEPDTMVQIFYKARENINANITGTGHFGANIAFYTSNSFYQQIYDSPYEVNLNQLLYVQITLNRPDNSLLLFLDTCVASPNPNDFKDRSYDLLRNGCRRDNTYYSYTSGEHYYARFSFQAFKFLRTHTYVYLQCKVIICPSNDYNSRCRQGCRPRRKRSLDSTYHTNTVTLGPIKLKGA